MSTFDREPTVYSRAISEIFNVEKFKYRDLEIPVKSQPRSLKVIRTIR